MGKKSRKVKQTQLFSDRRFRYYKRFIYVYYKNALYISSLETLDARRNKLCSKFATKAVKHNKHSCWFKINKKVTITRQQ